MSGENSVKNKGTETFLPQTIPEPISPKLWPCALQIAQQLGRAKKNKGQYFKVLLG